MCIDPLQTTISGMPGSIDLYADEADRIRHIRQIADIADENKRDISEVLLPYEDILRHLKKNTFVHNDLNIFAAKKVVEHLKISR